VLWTKFNFGIFSSVFFLRIRHNCCCYPYEISEEIPVQILCVTQRAEGLCIGRLIHTQVTKICLMAAWSKMSIQTKSFVGFLKLIAVFQKITYLHLLGTGILCFPTD